MGFSGVLFRMILCKLSVSFCVLFIYFYCTLVSYFRFWKGKKKKISDCVLILWYYFDGSLGMFLIVGLLFLSVWLMFLASSFPLNYFSYNFSLLIFKSILFCFLLEGVVIMRIQVSFLVQHFKN